MSVEDFRQSDYFLSIVEKNQKGQWPAGCESCANDEKIGLISYRMQSMGMDYDHLHINIGNLCDSDCIMCGPEWSSKIAARLGKFPNDNILGTPFHGRRSLLSDPIVYARVIDTCRSVSRINIIGGEPFIDPYLWKLLDDIKRSDLTINLISNGNTDLTQEKLSILQEFYKINIQVSIDSIGCSYEWIRQGLSWNKVMDNLKIYKSLSNINLTVHLVVQAHNLLYLEEHKKIFESLDIPISYDMLRYPVILRPSSAPKHILQEALERCQLHDDQLSIIIKNSYDTHNPYILEALLSHTDYLNSHRTHKFDTESWQVIQNSSCKE